MKCVKDKKYNLLWGEVLEEKDDYYLLDRSFLLGRKKDGPTTNVMPKSDNVYVVELSEEEFNKESLKVHEAWEKHHGA